MSPHKYHRARGSRLALEPLSSSLERLLMGTGRGGLSGGGSKKEMPGVQRRVAGKGTGGELGKALAGCRRCAASTSKAPVKGSAGASRRRSQDLLPRSRRPLVAACGHYSCSIGPRLPAQVGRG